MNEEKIKKTYQAHNFNEDQLDVISEFRCAFRDVDTLITEKCKASRETSKALTDLESSMMWVIKSLFVNA